MHDTIKALAIAFTFIALAAVSPWVAEYFSSAKRSSEYAQTIKVADLSWIESGLLRYYIEFDRFPDTLSALVPEQPEVQFRSMPSFSNPGGIDMGQIPESLENGTAKYSVSPDRSAYILWSEISGDKAAYQKMASQLDPRDRKPAEGMYFGINCSDKKIYCLHGTAKGLMDESHVQEIRAPGYKIYVTGWRGTPNLYPDFLLIALQPEAGARYFVVDGESGQDWEMREVCSYWKDDPYCKNHFTTRIESGYRNEGTFDIKIVKLLNGKQRSLGTAKIVVTFESLTN